MSGHRTRACPVCNHASDLPVFNNHLVPVDGLDMSYRIARCDGCGFHFADWLPGNDSYGRYYAELSKYDSQPTVSPVDRQRIEAALALCGEHVARDARIVDLGCAFALAEVTHVPESDGAKEPAALFDHYLAGSERRLQQVLQRIPDQPFVLYGAGSHSARLVPRLGDKARHIVAVADGNANLHGKRFGDWTVQPPDALAGYAGLPIVISSYRAEQAIARSLRATLDAPLVLLYG